MSRLKLTKNELRDQQLKHAQLEKYLPTLQLKKALLQVEVNNANFEINKLKEQYVSKIDEIKTFNILFSDVYVSELFDSIRVLDIKKSFENIAGIDIPTFEKIVFEEVKYSLFDTPLWIDCASFKLKIAIEIREKINIAIEKKNVLQKELKDVSIRVNLFEKIMIPRTVENIKKIKIFLGDQQLSAVATAKVAKKKIEARKK